MTEASSSSAVAVYGFEAADITRCERDRLVLRIENLDGVLYATPAADESALIYVGLANGRPFDGDDTLNPIAPDTDAGAYDPDGVREALIGLAYRSSEGITSEPHRMYMHGDHVEYAVPLNYDSADFSSVPRTRTGKTTLDVRPSARDRPEAYLRANTCRPDVQPTDVSDLTEAVATHIDHLNKARAREIICEFFGFDPEDAPYGDLRDAPEEVQAEYWQKLAQIADLHAEAADLIAEFDAERAADHRHTKTMEYDAYLQGVPSEWLADET